MEETLPLRYVSGAEPPHHHFSIYITAFAKIHHLLILYYRHIIKILLLLLTHIKNKKLKLYISKTIISRSGMSYGFFSRHFCVCIGTYPPRSSTSFVLNLFHLTLHIYL